MKTHMHENKNGHSENTLTHCSPPKLWEEGKERDRKNRGGHFLFDHYRVLTPKPSQCHISNSIYPNLGKIDGRVERKLNKERHEEKKATL